MLDLSMYGTATIGSVIDALKSAPAGADVQFDFCYLAPTTVNSYRGYYDHLALGWSEPSGWPTVATVLAELQSAIGKTFEGYKGGDYKMDRDTPLWVANYSHSGGTGIVSITVEGEHSVIINTAKVD